jgi:glycosyltransferase involved in cell wall biosynthesis
MKVSIVIPAYNEEKYIAETLRAVTALDYPDFEVIVVDNASTDKTAEIAKRFPVKVVREEKKGILHARERGRREATGEIIANIDADCLPTKDWLKNAVKHFQNKKIVAVSGPYYYFDSPKSSRLLFFVTQKYAYAISSKLLQLVGKNGILIGGNTLFRAKAMQTEGGYDTSILFYGEDTDTAKKLSQYGKILFSPKVVMHTSARRFQDEGTSAVLKKYLYHFFKITFSKSNKKGEVHQNNE